MIKKLVLFIFLILFFAPIAFAEKIPVKIAPIQVISTHNDEIEMGDYISFVVVKDVYIDNKLYLKKDTPIIAFVNFLHPNGWAGDSADIKMNSFETTDVNGQRVTINYPLEINGNSLKANDIKLYLADTILRLIRGSEIFIEPDTKIFNIFIDTNAK